jgi:hypothetical protein
MIEQSELMADIATIEQEAAQMRARMVRLEKERDSLLAMCVELSECAEYWSEYDVPIGIVDRLNAAIAAVEPTGIAS